MGALIYGKKRKSDADLEIGRIKKAISDFAEQLTRGKRWKGNNIKKEIEENEEIENSGG